MTKRTLFLLFYVLFGNGQPAGVDHTSFVSFTPPGNIVFSKPNRILLVHTYAGICCSGIDTHIYNIYKKLLDNGYYATLVMISNSPLITKINSLSHLYQLAQTSHTGSLKQVLDTLCKTNNISLIHGNYTTELGAINTVAKARKIHKVFTYHLPYDFDYNLIRSYDAVIGVGQHFITDLSKKNREKNLNIGQVVWIPPLCGVDKFLLYKPDKSQKQFFKETFNLVLKDTPIFCTIGNMYEHVEHKNYPLLFQALAHLVYKKNRPVQLVVAGDGPKRAMVEELAKKMHLDKLVTFLGFTDKIPDILYHTDGMILASSKEAFGISWLEAGLMGRPGIGARGTGAENIIVHEKTGLLFNKDNMHDLVSQIEKLIDDQAYGKGLGAQAQAHIKQHFLPDIIFRHLEMLYECITFS